MGAVWELFTLQATAFVDAVPLADADRTPKGHWRTKLLSL